ncbi:carbohydrate ABC transporter ATP-binding protein (CUT1 family) [Geothermobacter ehrlichii]|uniref:Carbohydrate ABC transporter ATP-binding protein (CUT1 family) n=1 Tax=Geothermobacter ehrlichii TaxID=213224 RepID=A0A5D3WGT6_9BACT|nr:ATP-binding cassette domain-containing protein [Geothermobacter ehrlichii]TYO95800.1 carbohydrate ABC transporter ATP-binding protein (CUT1 family) [Geothermobacter ehrlichii]
MEQLVEIRDLLFSRENFILRVDRLELQRGRLYLLTGPNGAGKSTLLRLLAQLLTPDRGEIRFQGRLVASERDRQQLRRQITLVEQTPFLFAGTVGHNLAFGLRLRGIRGRRLRQLVTGALAAVDLVGFEERRTDSLSGGEAQRVALARALVLEPKLLLLDEATASLDAEVLPLFEGLVARLLAEGVTVVLSSHDRESPRRLDARHLVMDGGILHQVDRPFPALSRKSETEQKRCHVPLKAHGS